MRPTLDKRLVLAVTLLLAAAGCPNSPTRSPDGQQPAPLSQETLAKKTPNKARQRKTSFAATESPTETFDSHRFLLLSRRPVLVELRVSINGSAPSQNLNPLHAYVLAAADTDGDQQSTWNELMANDTFVRSPLIMPAAETLPTDDEAEPDPPDTSSWSGNFDRNRDSIVDRNEVLPFITDFPFNQLVTFESGPSYGDDSLYESGTLRIIDTNKNEQFDQEELAALEPSPPKTARTHSPTSQHASTLMAYDFNDDELVTLAELTGQGSSPDMTDGMMAVASTTNYGPAALVLLQDRAWIRNHFLLKKRYGVRGGLSAGTFESKTFAALNRNADTKIDENELQSLCDIPPEVTIHVRLTDQTDTLMSDAQYFKATSSTSGQFHMDGLTLACGLLDTQNRATASPTKSNDNLLQQALTCVAANRIRVSIHDQQDAVFHLLDQNGDWRLSLREVRQARSTIEQSDKNQDRITFVEEINAGMQMGIRRAGRDSGRVPDEPRPVLASSSNDNPEWFTAMDRNNDGELSQREFLGTSASFGALDSNQDNSLSPTECRQRTPNRVDSQTSR